MNELEAVSVRLPKLLVEKIDAIRKRSINFPTRTAIIRSLLEKAIASQPPSKDSGKE